MDCTVFVFNSSYISGKMYKYANKYLVTEILLILAISVIEITQGHDKKLDMIFDVSN